MARPSKTDREKQEFIDLHFEQYKDSILHLFNQTEWESLDPEKQYRRIYDWLRRRENKETAKAEKKEAEHNYQIKAFADRLKNIDDLTVLKMLELKREIDGYIDNHVKEKKYEEIAEKKKELDGFEAETKRQLNELEEKRKADKARLEKEIKEIEQTE